MSRPHGHHLRYTHGPDENDQPGKGCRCGKCRAASTKNRARQRVAVIIGTHRPDEDARAAREHVTMLRDRGMDVPSIARAAGVGVNTVKELLYGGTKTVRPKTHAALLAVQAGDLNRPGLTSSLGTCRRVRALSAMGYPERVITRESRVSRKRVQALMSDCPPARVTAGTARKISEAYRRLTKSNPTAYGVDPDVAQRLRGLAAAKGWLSPAAWQDIDDPQETPTGVRRAS
ncbi:hypothetical protein HS041_12115 [Planomonospora sp. ID67723]|uniref:helix-turn-helix domain-containing protein n=1 Tax=Planomonospora sp. ID67723 TaxID=2738134 RepID=UPI0018C422FA|nr:helix-turn-helix transcriptional regulator [Planomonospora sp. ID67723]MBG0828513.1 hypothetical protein [Planomonospora sp. ID67723]